MKAGDKNYLIIDEAYNEYLKFAQQNTEKVEGLKVCIHEFHKDIMNWNSVTTLDSIIDTYLVGKLADCVAAPGPGRGNKSEFIRFMNDKNTINIINKLIEIKRKCNINIEDKERYKLIKSIQDAGILQNLNKWTTLDGKSKPIILVERFLCILFNELFTSIANYKDLLKVAKKLGIISEDVKETEKPHFLYFQQIQSDVRNSINNYFMIKCENVENHVSFSIAWFITEIK